MLAVAKVFGQLGFQRALDDQFGEPFQQPVLAYQVFGLLVIGQQAGYQFIGYVVFHYGHHRSSQCGSFLPGDRLHKNSYTLPTGLEPR